MVHGSIEVLVVAARNLKDTEILGKMDPFIQLRCDSQTKRSKTCYGGGKNPTFNDTITFNIIDGVNQVHLDVFDEDTMSNDHIGIATVDLDKAFKTNTDDLWVPIRRPKSGKPAGEVRLVIYFKPRQAGAPAPTPQPAYTAVSPNGYPGYAAPAPAPVAYTPAPVPVQPMMQYPPQPAYPQYPPQQVYGAPSPYAQPGYPAPYPQPMQQGYPPQYPPQQVYGAPAPQYPPQYPPRPY